MASPTTSATRSSPLRSRASGSSSSATRTGTGWRTSSSSSASGVEAQEGHLEAVGAVDHEGAGGVEAGEAVVGGRLEGRGVRDPGLLEQVQPAELGLLEEDDELGVVEDRVGVATDPDAGDRAPVRALGHPRRAARAGADGRARRRVTWPSRSGCPRRRSRPARRRPGRVGVEDRAVGRGEGSVGASLTSADSGHREAGAGGDRRLGGPGQPRHGVRRGPDRGVVVEVADHGVPPGGVDVGTSLGQPLLVAHERGRHQLRPVGVEPLGELLGAEGAVAGIDDPGSAGLHPRLGVGPPVHADRTGQGQGAHHGSGDDEADRGRPGRRRGPAGGWRGRRSGRASR